jgi:hypothetical protein
MKYAKAWAALVGSILTALSATTGIIPESAKPWVSFALAIVTAFATFQIPNTQNEGDAA